MQVVPSASKCVYVRVYRCVYVCTVCIYARTVEIWSVNNNLLRISQIANGGLNASLARKTTNRPFRAARFFLFLQPSHLFASQCKRFLSLPNAFPVSLPRLQARPPPPSSPRGQPSTTPVPTTSALTSRRGRSYS